MISLIRPPCGSLAAHEPHDWADGVRAGHCGGQLKEEAAAAELAGTALRLAVLRLYDTELSWRAECDHWTWNALRRVVVPDPSDLGRYMIGMLVVGIEGMDRGSWRIVAASADTPGDREEHR